MNILTTELPKCLEFETDSFVELFTKYKEKLLIDIIKQEVLSSKKLSILFDKLSNEIAMQEFEKLFKLPKFWKILVSCRKQDDYYILIEKMLLNELYFSGLDNSQFEKNSIISEDGLIWNLRCQQAYKKESSSFYENKYIHDETDILIDFFSDLARGKQRDIPWEDSGVNLSKIEKSIPKINAALGYIKSVSESCFTMLKNSIYSAVVRFDDSKKRFNCASTNTCNGLVVLINPHLEGVSIETIADAIVHEMTHNLFDIAELYEPCVPTKFHPRVIKSPWTGRMLDPNTYIQACYTWFGLKNFWQKAYFLHQSENANYYLKQSLKGFATTDFISIAKSEGYGFDQRIITTLESLQ